VMGSVWKSKCGMMELRLGDYREVLADVWPTIASRTLQRAFMSWGAVPGWYRAGIEFNGHIGGKPLALMRAIVRDYSRPGDLVVDPCAGGGTTLLAAAIEGRRAIGAEIDPETYAKAVERLSRPYTPVVRFDAVDRTQGALL